MVTDDGKKGDLMRKLAIYYRNDRIKFDIRQIEQREEIRRVDK